jgi:predicted enzyme related to lactoylglutathione lyase
MWHADRVSPDVLFAGIAVDDFPAAIRWYERLLGRPADIVVRDGEVMWKIAEAAWLYVLDDRARAGNSLVTMAVPDLVAAVHEIGDRGIISPPIETIVGAGRKASFTDPEGNVISFIEVDAH